jgi:hypothetical protein
MAAPGQHLVCQARLGVHLAHIRCELSGIERLGDSGLTVGGDRDEKNMLRTRYRAALSWSGAADRRPVKD